ncbi:hypothetical protein [Rhodanobacter sp. C01]|uniref:hypothetical protein n=1 Tax=Rhodanobacter sp. C01 TaxID=1945856 RepID=UPI0011156D29|nr:hypothetical protein [Rhodanobacter sp. C01]
MLAALLLTTVIYWPGLAGSWLFDDYPNIVDNHGVQPSEMSIPALVRAALSSPASDFKRPLASLSFAANYIAIGLDPHWMKLTNLSIHLLNGLLVFMLARLLLRSIDRRKTPAFSGAAEAATLFPAKTPSITSNRSAFTAEAVPKADLAAVGSSNHAGIVAALIATGWMLLPINLTAVLYVVQRMESMANLFVLLGLIGYVAGRQRMLVTDTGTFSRDDNGCSAGTRGFILCMLSIIIPTAVGVLAKETAVMLPLYALLVEWVLFHFCTATGRRDWRIIASFLLVLVLPTLIGIGWLLPNLLKPEAWATRDFTLGTRLLSETRIVVDYIRWTLLPTLDALSFYHDDFRISTGLLAPWTTLASLVSLVALVALMLWLRARKPLAALGIALFLGCQLLTGTILPLELIYEHRNYFASFGLMLAVVPLLAVPRSFSFARLRYTLLAGLLVSWATLTAMTAYAWGEPLRLAQELAARAPQSPRAQYELGRTYIIDSHYDPASPFTKLAYAPLEKAAALPNFSILPEQALIFMNARMQLPLKDAWWDSIVTKLKTHTPGVQDESALASLTQCTRDGQCVLPPERMKQAFAAALSQPAPTGRLLAIYGDYAWNVLGDHALGVRMTAQAVDASPNEPAYRITLIRMLAVTGRHAEADRQLQQLAPLNIGGRLDGEIAKLEVLLNSR